MKLLTKILGDPNEKYLKSLNQKVEQINVLEKDYKELSHEDLKKQKEVFQKELKNGKTLDEIMPRAFAVVREAAKRTLGQRHYDVQLIGGMVLHSGQIAEMKTGEGKTLTSTLAVYLNALEDKGVHLVTVNDYLAKRDAVWMGQVYNYLGMTVGVIQHQASFLYDPEYGEEGSEEDREQGSERDKKRDDTGSFKVEKSYLRPVQRKEAYAADITYGTNNEFGFDYLRDNMAQKKEQVAQRDLHYTIVDEIDSILIDEARTPLIISAPDSQSSEMYGQFAQIARSLDENKDYNKDEKMRAATLTDDGISKVEKSLGIDNLYAQGGITMVHHIEQALRSEVLFQKDKDYVVKDGEIVIVDEFTGRLMEGRRYSEGLHQAIEAKEGVEVKRESKTLATITFQNFFRMYKKLSGMTGTAATEAEEFSKIYSLDVTTIPTNKPTVRDDRPDRIYKTEKGKYVAVAKEVKERHQAGQPVLIGTISIEKNEMLGSLLKKEGLNPNILNAKQHEKEGNVIAQAGAPGAITVATNMAGRGVDVILGGNPPTEETASQVRQAQGLHVIGTERHESRRIDNQLRGRSGRQGDVGSTQFYVSTEDDLMRIFGSDRMRKIMDTLKIPDDMPIENKMISRSLEAAQKKVEGHNFDTRKHLVEYDDVINKHRETIYRKRKSWVVEDDIKKDILEMIEQEIEHLVSTHTASENANEWNVKEIQESAHSMFGAGNEVNSEIESLSKPSDKLQVAELRTKLIDYLQDRAFEVYENQEKLVVDNLGQDHAMRDIEKQMSLQAIDTLWIDHLEAMDHLRTGIGLRGYGQRDPLVEYKKEAYRIFSELMSLISKQVVYSIFKVGAAHEQAIQAMPFQNMKFSAPAKTMQEGGSSIMRSASPTPQIPQTQGNTAMKQQVDQREAQDTPSERTHFDGQKVGRNELCPCGSGKKFKKCHGA